MDAKIARSWNLMLSAFSKNGRNAMALQLLEVMTMQDCTLPDGITYVHALSGCISHENLAAGKKIHVYAICRNMDLDVITNTSLISMYDRCGDLEIAREVFRRMAVRNVVTWNAMLSAYSHHGCNITVALQFFRQMLQESTIPNRVTYVCILDACIRHDAGVENKSVLAMATFSGFQTDVILATTAITLYGKLGYLSDASHVFDGILRKNVVSWNALMAAFARNRHSEEVRNLFANLQKEGLAPDDVSFLCFLSVCVLEDGSLIEGKTLHNKILLTGLESSVSIATGIMNMYAKCGSLEDALWTSDRMHRKDAVSWSAMIAAYAQHGYGENALQSWNDMVAHGTEPDEVTYLNMLIACSHGGLVDQGLHFWLCLKKNDLQIMPIAEHDECVIDLLGRAGRLHEAELILEQCCAHDRIVPRLILLGTCKNLFDLERAQCICKNLLGCSTCTTWIW
jgi:pentatricopeptide repeat protein